MIKLKKLIGEVIDDPYRYSSTFSYETITKQDDDTGDEYEVDVFSPVQIIRFKTDDGVEYLWYAKQSHYNENFWTIAFGVYKGTGYKGAHEIDIELIGNSKNVFRVFATVLDITNRFIEIDENNEIHYLSLESTGNKRTEFYLKHLVPRIEKFELETVQNNGMEESTITLVRKY